MVYQREGKGVIVKRERGRKIGQGESVKKRYSERQVEREIECVRETERKRKREEGGD